MGEKEKEKEKKDKEKKKKEKEKATVRSAPDGSDNKNTFVEPSKVNEWEWYNFCHL